MIFSYDKPISVLFYDKPPTNEHSQSQVLQKNSPFGSLPHRMRTNFIVKRERKKIRKFRGRESSINDISTINEAYVPYSMCTGIHLLDGMTIEDEVLSFRLCNGRR
jgi:hypothetical protein